MTTITLVWGDITQQSVKVVHSSSAGEGRRDPRAQRPRDPGGLP